MNEFIYLSVFVHFLWINFDNNVVNGFSDHDRGPQFVMEPPSRLEFSNSSGGWLDCSASGSPQPTIDWISIDGNSIGDVGGIRRVLRNGTLVLLPFPAASYRQDIHSTIYRCVASNRVGRIISRDVNVRAVVTQSYKVDVEILPASRGCTAILRCIVPGFVKELVRVVSWVQEPAFYIYPSLQGDGKYHLLPSGELLVHNLEFNDRYASYRCRTMHKLTRQVVMSDSAKIRINEHRGIISPSIVDHSALVSVSQDEGAVLLCIAQGCPSVEYRWYTQNGAEMLPVLAGPRMRLLGPVLAVEAVQMDDAGIYKCSAMSSGSEASAELKLTVSTSIQVEISPNIQSVNMGGSAEFRCLVTSNGSPISAHHITWFKDGRQLPLAGRNGDTLLLSAIGREDKGMYQCVVRRPEGDTFQASAELQLGDAPPTLLYSFIEQTLQPGPAVSLKCSSTGNPTPEIIWLLDGFPLPQNGRFMIGQYVTAHGDVISHVNITHVMVEDGGEYMCIAENRAGKTQHSARLNVYGMPYIRLIPKVSAIAGETLHLKCPVAGWPIEEVHWERGGTELPSDIRQKVQPDGTLVVSPVQKKDDSGVYTCWARNKQGYSARRSGEVNVIVPPKISPFHSTMLSLNVGDRASITCSVQKGDTPLHIKWLKNGILIDPSQRISVTQVDQFNSILVIEHLQASHSGNYSCVVSNQAAEVESSQALLVNVPPVIEPFAFQSDLSEGMRTRLICGVSRGDLPLRLTWLKDGEFLMPSLGANASTLDQFTSILSIPSLSHTHSGEYTCVASNQASEVKFSASLQVKVPPRWKIEPADVSVERNRHVTLHCQAEGVPTPSVIWKKATGSKSGDYEEIREKPYTKLLSNGSLLLQHVKEDREGFYICQANNGIGSGIGKVIQLKVNSSPYFSAPSRMVSVKKGDTAILQCEVSGDKPINVVWLRGGKNELNPSTNYRVSIKQDATPEGISAEVQIINVEASDSGQYFCQARNLYGTDQQLVQLQVQEPPQPVNNLETIMVSSRSVNLKWQPRGGDSTEVTKYIVEYREIDRQWQRIEISNPPQFSALIENLKPATRYAFRVIAEGNAGPSLPSQELVIRTEPQRPAGPPLHLSARPLSATELLITWQPPLHELRHGDVQGYNIGYKTTTSQSNSFNFTSTSGDGEDGSGEMILSGLSKFTRYTIVVQAFNQIGVGPLSEPVTAQTMEDVPSSPPEDLRCAALSSTSLQVSWQPPPLNHQNGLLQGYKASFETISDDYRSESEEMDTRKTTALTTVLTSLRKYSNYSIQVLAYTRMGDGVSSQAIFCKTEEDVPEAPVDIKVMVSSTNSLYVSWLEPREPNGVITKYNLYIRQVNGRDEMNNDKRNLPSSQTYFEAKGLQGHMEYQFWVTASTKIGEGKSSRVASQVTSNRVSAKIISFGGLVIRPWKTSVTLTCLAVGQPRREWFKNDISLKNMGLYSGQVLDSGELMMSNLQLTDSGNFSCQVDNGIGTDRITYNLVVQVPPSAPSLYVTSATSSSILMHWKNTGNGNAPVTAYTLHYKRHHGNLEELQLSRHASSHELKDLNCGSQYSIYLTTHNKIGHSLPSSTLNVRTQGHSPGIPIPSLMIFPNSTSIVFKLSAWPDNGCPVLYFVLQYRAIRNDGEDQWTLVSNALKPQKRFIVNNLQPSTMYQLRMEAYNIAGHISQDFTAVTLTKDGDPPPEEILNKFHRPALIYNDAKIIITAIITLTILICSSSIVIICMKLRQKKRHKKEATETLKKAEIQRDRYYATIHKVPLHPNDKIPESSEDISPYATFQLSEAPTLAHPGPTNTLLHSFMYHERAMTEGCASPPPQVLRQLHNQSPYYNISSKGKRRHSRKDPESEESDSDQDGLTSSRTESSNQIEQKLKHRTVPSTGIIYHGGQSSTSSDLSPPMSDKNKSLPRRGRSRTLALRLPLSLAESGSEHFHQIPISIDTGMTPDRIEISEAECDIDTMKKLKLGMRSSLWSRPTSQSGGGGNNSSNFQPSHPSDYSIAV